VCAGHAEASVNRLVIRTASDGDLKFVVDHYAPGGGDSPWDPFVNLERIQRIPRAGLMVAESDGTYAGFLYWYEGRKPWYAPSVDKYARISDLHILPASQGKGLGRALLRDALRRISEAGIETVFLETDEDNTRARGLYESEGFVRVAPGVARFRRQSGPSESGPATR
jgi:ribosomal protein S18 acetylase RimI-like enzyme